MVSFLFNRNWSSGFSTQPTYLLSQIILISFLVIGFPRKRKHIAEPRGHEQRRQWSHPR